MKEVAIKTNASISFSFSPKVLVVFKYILNANRANRIPAINVGNDKAVYSNFLISILIRITFELWGGAAKRSVPH